MPNLYDNSRRFKDDIYWKKCTPRKEKNFFSYNLVVRPQKIQPRRIANLIFMIRIVFFYIIVQFAAYIPRDMFRASTDLQIGLDLDGRVIFHERAKSYLRVSFVFSIGNRAQRGLLWT